MKMLVHFHYVILHDIHLLIVVMMEEYHVYQVIIESGYYETNVFHTVVDIQHDMLMLDFDPIKHRLLLEVIVIFVVEL